ncbi:response regulator [Paenibacillus sp. PL2-23]|uniref:response regulator n=1 Tax=Paenibacillus sp. PL2-23 TaxID=2100729 RepID=UPI0030F8AA72
METSCLTAVIVDDELLALDLLEKTIGDTEQLRVIGKFSDAEEALEQIATLRPDVLFLDVEMPELNGMELAATLMDAEHQHNMDIVFVTAFEHYAIHAFTLNAVHYILKPADAESILEVVKRVRQKERNERRLRGSGEVVMLGGMYVRSDGEKPEPLTGKLEELLSLLILNREKGISKWMLMDILWESSSLDKSQQNLHTMVYRLKKTLKNAGLQAHIKCKNNIYTIDLADGHCDVVEFDNITSQELLRSEPDMDRLERAIALYKGELLEDKDYVWCIGLRERYHQVFYEAVMLAADYYIRTEQPDKLTRLQARVELLEEEAGAPYDIRLPGLAVE